MDEIFQQHREELVDLHATVDKAEIEMEPLVRADQPNESAVMAQIDKVAQARAELEKANARFLFELARQIDAGAMEAWCRNSGRTTKECTVTGVRRQPWTGKWR